MAQRAGSSLEPAQQRFLALEPSPRWHWRAANPQVGSGGYEQVHLHPFDQQLGLVCWLQLGLVKAVFVGLRVSLARLDPAMPCPAHALPFHLQEEAKGRQLRAAGLQAREQRVPDILRFLHRSPDWRCSCGLCALLAGMPLRKLQPWQRQQVLHYMARCLWMHVVRRAAVCYLGAACAMLWLALMH